MSALRSLATAAIAVLAGCTPTESTGGRGRHHRESPADTDLQEIEIVEPTGTTGYTGDTAPIDTAPEVDPDCVEAPPVGPFPVSSTRAIQTEEDFDFDIDGYLLSQRNTSLQGFDRDGNGHIVAANIGVDAAGIRSLSTGDVMVAQPDTGSLRLVDHATGGSNIVLGGLDFPNGLEATADGRVFSSELARNGYIRLLDPYTGAIELIAQMNYPNNMALSPDERTLYVVASNSSFGSTGRIMALDKGEDGTFSEPRLVHEHNELLGGITTDKCGNIYAAEYSGGRVFRIRTSDEVLESIADLPPGSYSSARFGPGLGGWERTTLLVTSRFELHAIEVGIEGRHVLAP